MKTLILLRHAKSSWKDETLPDFDRPLNKRGRLAAKMIAQTLSESRIQPEQILCSPSKRTRETLEQVQTAFPSAVPIRFEKGIYMADAPVLLRRLRRLAESLGSVMVVGHNPGLEQLALMVTEGSEDQLRHDMALKYPTGAVAVIGCDVDHWNDMKAGCGRIEVFVRPGELPGD